MTCDRCGLEHPRCTAHNRSGQPCGHMPAKGQTVCKLHGGSAPQSKAAAARRLLADEARADLARLGVAIPVSAPEALEAMLAEAAGNVVFLRELVGTLDQKASTLQVVNDEDGARVVSSGNGIAGPTGSVQKPFEAQPHIYVTLYNDERDRLARIAKDCAALGLDERRIRIAEGTAERLFTAVTEALDAAGLTPEQEDAFRGRLAVALRNSGPAALAR